MNTHTSLIQHIQALLTARPINNDYFENIRDDNIETMKYVMSHHPRFFETVQTTLLRNIKDNQIRVENVPSLIALISHLHHLLLLLEAEQNLNSNTTNTVATCGEIMKFIFMVAIREDIVFIDSDVDIMLLILSFDNIMDSCIKLLTPSKPYSVLTEYHPRRKKTLPLGPSQNQNEPIKRNPMRLFCFGPSYKIHHTGGEVKVHHKLKQSPDTQVKVHYTSPSKSSVDSPIGDAN